MGRIEGLTAAEVEESRRKHGENVLTPPPRQSMWRLYLEKYQDPMVRILLVAALVSLVLAFVKDDFMETLGIIAAIILATTVGFYFERDAARRFDVLTQLSEEQPVKVLRNLSPALPHCNATLCFSREGEGARKREGDPNREVDPNGEGSQEREGIWSRVIEIPRREVVVGDVVIVETGDEVPADGRLFEATGLQVDESSLTGEAMTEKGDLSQNLSSNLSPALPKGEGAWSREGEPNHEGDPNHEGNHEGDSNHEGAQSREGDEAYPKDMLLRSSMVMSGSGRYVVLAVGDETEIGHVARQATELTGVKTPLNMQLDRLAKLISKVGGIVAMTAFVVFLVHDILTNDLWQTSNYLGMLEVALKYFMMAVTLIVMAVPEGLPMAVTLALALNMRRMLKSNNLVRKLQASETMGAVTVICTDKTGTLTENRMTVSDVRCMMEDGRGMTSDISPQPSALYNAIALNTTATHDVGNPTEQALLRWMMEQGVDYQQLRSNNPISDRLPFSTENKYMTTTVGDTLYIKGAPEVIMDRCRLTADERQQLDEQLLEWQRHAMRTLAVAQDDRLLAIFAISDPLRKEVPEAIRQCDEAGIDVKIVTGDTVATAMEIARQCGLKTSHSITGAEFAAMSDEEALQHVKALKVMSRARPTDKQRLVSLLQRQGEVVAVTGDGTNDAPALNRAHVGLSLGSGTSVAKQASDITLLDDSFRSIVQAVMWGRSLYKNIQRFIFFQLIVNVTALLLVLFGAFIGTEMPLTITQILWVNLIMDTFAAMALASLPPSREVLKEEPRSKEAFIITRPMLYGICIIGGLFFVVTAALLWHFERVASIDPVELTIFFTLFVLLQWWNLFNARMLGSNHSAFRRLWACRGFLLVLALVLVGQWLIVTFGGQMFRTVPLPWQTWLWMFIVTSPVLWVGEIYRAVCRVKSGKVKSEEFAAAWR